MNEWIDNRKQEPTKDGTYLAQMIHGGITGLDFTIEGGWNTHYDTDGELYTDHAIDKNRVARWLDAPAPPEVSDEWFTEAMRRMR